MNLNNIFEITTISILIILYYLGVLMYLIFGYLFLVNDYNIANKCKDSNLWAFVLVNIIISTTGFIKLIVKKESVFEEFSYFSQLAKQRLHSRFFSQHDPQLEAQNPSRFVPKSIQEALRNEYKN